MRRILLFASFFLPLLAGAGPKYICYEQFGAKGDGRTDDMKAIVAAHDAANAKGLPVRARDKAVYYIGGADLTAVIKTDTDWGKAHFIIDDRSVENRNAPVFRIESTLQPFDLKEVKSLQAGQEHLGIPLPERCLVSVADDSRRVYIRTGGNINKGTAASEVFIAEKDGRIAPQTPLVWDYRHISSLTAYPIDAGRLTVKGGVFTTLTNQEPALYNYYDRGIEINRSHVVLEGLSHSVEGEAEHHGAPYSAFLNIKYAAEVVVRDCVFTAHRIYFTTGSSGTKVRMGSYDLGAVRSADVLWQNCRQSTDIDDARFWGIFGSNFCKDLKMEGCSFSRFDAHMGVCNLTLKDCTFGHQGVRMVGFGRLLMEGCEVRSYRLLNLRPDYGSSWDGDIVIRDCVLRPVAYHPELVIIDGKNTGLHDYGYTCSLPRKVEVRGLYIDDTVSGEVLPYVFSDFNRHAGAALLPLKAEGEIVLDSIRVRSGKLLGISKNEALFQDYRVSVSGGTLSSDPRAVGKMISEQLLRAVPESYAPPGYDGAKPVGKGIAVPYAVVSTWTNALEFAHLSGDKELEKRLVDFFEPFYGEKKHIQNRDNHVDYSIFGALPLEIFLVNGDRRARQLGLRYANHQWEEPVGAPGEEVGGNGNFPLEKQKEYLAQGYTPQTRLWIDDMYMVTVLQSQAYRATGDMRYIERAAKGMAMYLDTLQRENGLFYHAPDVPFFWGRGNGWMAAGMPLLLKYLTKESEWQRPIMEAYKKMMASLLSLQRPDGLWGQLIDDTESWDETSGSAMFTYAFIEGVRHGWLDAEVYGPAARKAWLALCYKMDAWGNIADVCAGTNRKNSREWYMERPRVNGDPHGQAPMLWICNALLE